MRARRYFMATLKETPKEALIASHRLMLRAGMVQQITAGIYAWLPFGLRVLRKIEAIVRQEQNQAGAVEMLAPTLQPATLWQESGRYADYGKELLRVWDRHERELLYGPTAEEVFTLLFRTHIRSYKDLPQCLYNIQWKFRDEVRPRFGVMRGREFLMKDTYSFDLTQEGAKDSYARMFQAYMKTFARLGLQAIPVRASTGPIGGDLSHEFQIVTETGESTLYYDQAIDHGQRETLGDFHDLYAVADDQHDPATCPVPLEQLKITRGIEVGHIFYFGTKYSMPLGACVTHHSGDVRPVEMGSYGIGVSRLVGAIIEAFHDDKGIKWPISIAPYGVAVTAVGANPQTVAMAEHIYQTLQEKGADVFLYDLEKSAGEKFAELDLMGFPFQIIVGGKWVQTGNVDIKNRSTGDTVSLPVDQIESFLRENGLSKNIALG